jgi:hypothetical protein
MNGCETINQRQTDMRIDKDRLAEYLFKEEVAWQEWDGIMDVTHGFGSPEYEKAEKEILSHDSFHVVSRDEMLNTAFHTLADWSHGDKDILMQGDDSVLVCIPKFMFDKWFVNKATA